uniref:Uncharacterized protein n=1 Tax=Caldicellulosiruptor owensensis TaxID=55205 RepID=A0A7C5V5I0_9FIRM
MDYYTLIFIIFGFYGYFRFAYAIWKGKNMIKKGNRNVDVRSDKLEFIDFLVGATTLIASLLYKVEGSNVSFFVISMLYGVVLIIKSFRSFLKVLQVNIVTRKIYNYTANSYIIFSIWLLSDIIETKGIGGGLIGILLLYFITYYIIWKAI